MAANWADLMPYLDGTPEDFATWETLVSQHWPGGLNAGFTGYGAGAWGNESSADGHHWGTGARSSPGPVPAGTDGTAGDHQRQPVGGSPPLETMADIAATFPQIFYPF